MTYVFKVTPIGKPRMTRRDKWRQTRTDAANRYMEFRDTLQKLALFNRFKPMNHFTIIFYLPMANSWGVVKRKQMDGRPHQQKPDNSNLLKAFEDCLWEDDASIWRTEVSKYWTTEKTGWIEVQTANL